MWNDEIDTVWREIEQQLKTENKCYQRMICVDLLFRAYIGSSGVPCRRFLSLEIPEKESPKFDSFTAPQGFSLTIAEPTVKHEGYVACVLQSSSFDQNDVFTIVVKDIINDLCKQKESDKYVDTLKSRIEKWRVFFKNSARKKLSEDAVIGLFGELSFIDSFSDHDINAISDMWNGPIKSAQDFQGNTLAIEVKTSATSHLEYVHIASEVQLDNNNWDNMFLIAYRIERNDATGLKLPDIIDRVKARLSHSQTTRFMACLTCLGYSEEDSSFYDNGYSVKEEHLFRVKEGFPRILRQDLPQGVTDVKYVLALSCCKEFEEDIQSIISALKES